MKKKPRIAYCTWTDPRDKSAWSGTHHFILKALSDLGQLDVIGPIENKWVIWLKILNKFLGYIFKRKISILHTPVVAREYAGRLDKRLGRREYDLIFAPAGAELIAYLKTKIPIIYLSDATFFSMIDYYPEFSNLFPFAEKWGMEIERRAIHNATHIIYSSDWAAGSAADTFGYPRNQISVIPFGANIEKPPTGAEIQQRRNLLDIKKLKLIWVGVDWERKGGGIAYEVMKEMNRRRIETELIVCGCNPLLKRPHKGLRKEGFLNKNNPSQFHRLTDIYKEADVFIFPSRQECSAISIAEACCFGLPVLAFDTGGIGNYVSDGFNGFVLSPGSGVDSFADKLEYLINNPDKYRTMAQNSRKKYDESLNWERWKTAYREVQNHSYRKTRSKDSE